MAIDDLLNREVPVLEAQDPIEKVIELFRTQNIHAAPVTEKGKLSGIITLAAVYEFLSRPGHYDSCPVSWLMHKPATSVNIDATLAQVAQAMKDNHVFTIPVTQDGTVIGLISVESILESYMSLA